MLLEAAAVPVKEQVPARDRVFVILDPGRFISVHPHELADDVDVAAISLASSGAQFAVRRGGHFDTSSPRSSSPLFWSRSMSFSPTICCSQNSPR